jgi:hypothetical protein
MGRAAAQEKPEDRALNVEIDGALYDEANSYRVRHRQTWRDVVEAALTAHVNRNKKGAGQ